MAFSQRRSDRPESLIFRNPHSPREDHSVPVHQTPLSPLRAISNLVNVTVPSAAEMRGNLQRRFTTNALPTVLSPIGQQRRQAAEPQDYKSTVSLFESQALVFFRLPSKKELGPACGYTWRALSVHGGSEDTISPR